MKVDGLLLVDKPGGMTSHDVIDKLRRALGRRDIGHAGTLDPIATGLLVILVGKATKLSDFILNGDKSYRTRIQLGVVTDTDDISGEVQRETRNFQFTEKQIQEAVLKLTGEVELPVPIYSAIKVKGKKLYEKARNKETFTPPIKTMCFQNVKILAFKETWVEVEFKCSKGSYVRAWSKKLGEILGCGATVETLRRTHSSPYSMDSGTPLDEILRAMEPEDSQVESLPAWVPLNKTLPDWPTVKIEGTDEKLISNGQIPRKLERFLEIQYGGSEDLQGIKIVSKRSGRLVSLLSHQAPLSFKIRRVFPNQ